MSSIEKFIRSDLVGLGGYSAHRSPDTLKGVTDVPLDSIVKLDANENPYGCSPGVPEVLARYRRYHIYPDSRQTRLRQLLQEYTGVDTGYLIAANGSGELLDYILCLLLEPGDEVINCPPTFDLYRLRTLINRGKLVNVPRKEDFSVDVGAVKAAINQRTKVIVLANPNNPTGNVVPVEDILELVNAGVPVLVDEAYYEFYGQTVAPLVSQYGNLMVLRTFSKWIGLAGLRIGYGVLPLRMVDYVLKIKLPYNVNVAALVAVEESLRDVSYLQSKVKAIIAERERLFAELKKLEFLKPLPSQANFILCEVLRGKASELQQRLLEKGILVRYFDQTRLANTIRISVGKPEDSEKLIKRLREAGF